jgi:hypothetical protein
MLSFPLLGLEVMQRRGSLPFERWVIDTSILVAFPSKLCQTNIEAARSSTRPAAASRLPPRTPLLFL